MGRLVRALSLAVVGVVALFGVSARGASHLWVVNEVFSNADGTLQFVELWCPAPNETGLQGKSVHTNAMTSPAFPANLPPNSTANKYLLLATADFSALPGAPTPDLTLPSNFLALGGDSVQWHIYTDSILAYGAGALPTDGVQSLDKNHVVGPATPKNFAGGTFAPPGVSGLAVGKLPGFPDGSRLNLTWNNASCLGAASFHLVYGLGSQLPDLPGGTFGLQPAALGQCAIAGSPKIWSGVPNPASDPTGFLFFLVLAGDGAGKEGSWGEDSAGDERHGPLGGASGQCGATTKVLANTCS